MEFGAVKNQKGGSLKNHPQQEEPKASRCSLLSVAMMGWIGWPMTPWATTLRRKAGILYRISYTTILSIDWWQCNLSKWKFSIEYWIFFEEPIFTDNFQFSLFNFLDGEYSSIPKFQLRDKRDIFWTLLVPPAGIEPAAPGLGIRCSIHWATGAYRCDFNGLSFISYPHFLVNLVDCARNCARLRLEVGLLLLCS